jgi:hypothetical protein
MSGFAWNHKTGGNGFVELRENGVSMPNDCVLITDCVSEKSALARTQISLKLSGQDGARS